jgi:UDP:flavonoid glycosyltransferase YjiC (YdhE family)
MRSKKSILFVGEAASLAHVTRPLVLAQSLNPEEYEIHFACDARYHSLFGALPHIRLWHLPSVPGKRLVKGAARGDVVLTGKEIRSYVHDELALLDRVRPDLIVQDFRFTIILSAALSRIPYATLANSHWSPYRALEFKDEPEPPLRAPIGRRILNRAMFWKSSSSHESINSAASVYGLASILSPIRDYFDLATHGDYTLYVEPPGFIQMKPMPKNHFFLGPILWSPDVPKPSWWQNWDPNLPLIYLTLGSTGAATRLPEIVRVLGKLRANLVVATAGRVELTQTPPNVFVAPYLPGLEICGLASLIISNGGSATAYQALSQGTPVVGLWSNNDQYLTMMIIERAGAGRCFRAASCDSKEIADAIAAVLQDSRYRLKAAEMAESFRSYDACSRFQQFLLDIPGLAR